MLGSRDHCSSRVGPVLGASSPLASTAFYRSPKPVLSANGPLRGRHLGGQSLGGMPAPESALAASGPPRRWSPAEGRGGIQYQAAGRAPHMREIVEVRAPLQARDRSSPCRPGSRDLEVPVCHHHPHLLFSVLRADVVFLLQPLPSPARGKPEARAQPNTRSALGVRFYLRVVPHGHGPRQ